MVPMATRQRLVPFGRTGRGQSAGGFAVTTQELEGEDVRGGSGHTRVHPDVLCGEDLDLQGAEFGDAQVFGGGWGASVFEPADVGLGEPSDGAFDDYGGVG